VISITKEVIGKALLKLPASSCTVIVQLEYIQSAKALRVMVLFHNNAMVVADKHPPVIAIVPDSVELNV
jgi:alpha-D-ribose 1-methylphosphonate 5-triphosphate synthase subunit PhnH